MGRDERRTAIAVATIPLLELHGSQVSTRQIALAAGVAEGTLFRAFDDKVEILAAAAERAIDPTLAVEEIDALPDTGSLAGELEQVAHVMAARGRRVRRVMIAVHSILTSEEGHRASAVRAARGADARASAGDDGARAHHGPHRFGPGRDARLHALVELRAAIVRRMEAYRGELRVEPELVARMLLAMMMGQGPPGLPDDAEVAVTDLVDVLLHGVARP